MKTNIHFWLFLSLIPLLFISCKKDNLGISQATLSGLWLEEEPVGIIQFAGTNHLFQFNSDKSFTLKRDYWTDVISADSCYGSHSDYVMGTYSFTSSQFELNGKYSDPFYNVVQMNNCGETDYHLITKYKFSNGILTLNSDEELYYQIALHKQ